jgi:hypothetical protein
MNEMKRFSRKRRLHTCISMLAGVSMLVLLNVQAGAVCAAPDISKIKQAILSSRVIPPDYRQHVNINVSPGEVAIGVYRNPDAEPFDCKIDAILMAAKVLEAEPDVRSVGVAFYDISDPDRYWYVVVPSQAVSQYAAGKSTQDEVVHACELTIKRTNPLAKTYAGMSYQQIIRELPVVSGPLKKERAIALVRLNAVREAGTGDEEERREFLHIEDLARRGDAGATSKALEHLSQQLDAAAAKRNAERAKRLEALK